MCTHICCSCHSADSMALHQAEIRCEALPDGPNPVRFLIRWSDRKPSHGKVSIKCSNLLNLYFSPVLFVMDVLLIVFLSREVVL